MQFPNASASPANMLYPQDGTAFDMLSRFIEHEYVDPADMEMRGMLATLGIDKGKPFSPDEHTRDLLDKAAKTACRMGHAIVYEPLKIVPNALWYKDRRWAQRLSRQCYLHRGHLQLHRSAHRLLHYGLFDQPGHGGQHGECRREVPSDFRRRQWRLPARRQGLQVDLAKGHPGGVVLVGHGLRCRDWLRSR